MRSRSVQKYRKRPIRLNKKSSNSIYKNSISAMRARSTIKSRLDSSPTNQKSILKLQKSDINIRNKLNNSVFNRLYSKPEKKVLFNNSKSQSNSKPEANRFLKKLRKDFEKLELANRINNKNSRKFRMHKFVYEKKLKNELKYDDNSKLNHHAMPVPKGTISIMLNTKKKNTLFSYGDGRSKRSTKRSRFKIKWKTIQWLFLHKKEVVLEMLKSGKTLFLKFSEDKQKCILGKKEFIDLLTLSGLGGDSNLSEKLFNIFSHPKSKAVNFKDILVGLEIFRDSSLNQKFATFIEIADIKDTGYVNFRAVFDVFHVAGQGQRVAIKRYLQQIITRVNIDKNGYMKKKELLKEIREHGGLRTLLDQGIKNIQKVDKIIENDLEEHFQTWIPMSNNMVKYKEGIHFPMINQLLKVVKNNEFIAEKTRQRKKKYQDRLKKREEKSIKDIESFDS